MTSLYKKSANQKRRRRRLDVESRISRLQLAGKDGAEKRDSLSNELNCMRSPGMRFT